MNKIVVSACIHGNEQFGLKVLGEIQRNRSDIETIIGNPLAVAKNLRYIETDLNRSFNGKSNSLEEKIAQQILKNVEKVKPSLVIDLHSSVSDCGAVGIATSYSPENHILAQMCGMTNLVIMPPSNAYIEQFDVPAIALEFGKNLRSDRLAKVIASNINRILHEGLASIKPTIPVYEIDSVISKKYEGLATIKNLVYDKNLKGYPFLAGLHTYEHIGGFLLQMKMFEGKV